MEIFTANCFSRQGENIFDTVYSASNADYPNVSCHTEHYTQGTSPPWVNKQGNYLPITALQGDYIRNVITELKL